MLTENPLMVAGSWFLTVISYWNRANPKNGAIQSAGQRYLSAYLLAFLPSF